ncbi:MAG: two-component regulator propeller domain-containing protein [Acidobacteriota bacterium]
MRRYDSPLVVLMIILSSTGMTMVIRHSSAIASNSNQEPENPNQNKRIARHDVLRLLNRNRSTGMPLLGIEHVFEDRQGRYWLVSAFRTHVFEERRDEWSPVAIPEHTGVHALSTDDKLWYVPIPVPRSGPTPNIRQFPVGFNMMQTMQCFDLMSWQESELAPETRKAIEQSESSIMSFFPGRSGKLWCLLRKFDSRDNSLMFYDGQKWTGPIEPKKSRDSEFSRAAHANIGLQDSEGYVWLPGIKVVRFDGRKNEWKGYPEAPDIFALSIYEDRKGRIWIGGADGNVCVYDKGLDVWTSYKLMDHLPKTANKNDFDGLATEALYQDRAGQMMFGTRQGLFTLREAENKWELNTSENSGLPDNWIHSISEDKSGRIWIGTGHGVAILHQ